MKVNVTYFFYGVKVLEKWFTILKERLFVSQAPYNPILKLNFPSLKYFAIDFLCYFCISYYLQNTHFQCESGLIAVFPQ